MKKFTKFLTGVFFGAALGGLITLLYAPESSGDIRKKLQIKATRIISQIKDASKKRRGELEAEINKYRNIRGE